MCFLFLLLFCDHPVGQTVAKRKKASPKFVSSSSQTNISSIPLIRTDCSVNPMHNAPVELRPARAGPPAPCFTGLSLAPPPKTLHKERAVTGRIFQALPFQALPNFCPHRQTDRHHVAFIYRIANTNVGWLATFFTTACFGS